MMLTNRVAVITGAAGGIGHATAMALARRGCSLALVDIDPVIEQAAIEARQRGVQASFHQVDVADRAAVRNLPAAVLAAHSRVDILINNAGVAVGGRFDQVNEADFDWLMDINFNAVVRMTRAFLPYLRSSDEARIVNLSSIYGIIAPPGQCAYSASKFAVRGFSNALRHELAGTNVGVSVVHPGGVATSIVKNARVPAGVSEQDVERNRKIAQEMLRMPPEKAGEIIATGIERRKARILVGRDARFASILERLFPVDYWKIITKAIPR